MMKFGDIIRDNLKNMARYNNESVLSIIKKAFEEFKGTTIKMKDYRFIEKIRYFEMTDFICGFIPFFIFIVSFFSAINIFIVSKINFFLYLLSTIIFFRFSIQTWSWSQDKVEEIKQKYKEIPEISEKMKENTH